MRRSSLAVILFFACAAAAEAKARNVILFIGDAGGLPTLNAASLHGYGEPQKLFIQSMPHVALMDTSAANAWVTDSAAGMTAIVTGQKTNNGVISQSASAVRGKQDGEPLKTILEYAEERGLSTGVLSNMDMTDATPAACYAQSNDRRKAGEIFAQVMEPRFGDGVDLIVGGGRQRIFKAMSERGVDLEPALRKAGYSVFDSVEAIPEDARRVVALFDTGAFDLDAAAGRAIDILSKNRNGFFLMVEWDMHTTNAKAGLDRAVALDRVIRETAGRMKKDTLIVYAADHSFDLRVRGGRPGEPLTLPDPASADGAVPRAVRVDNSHTGEEVVVAAQGPGAERVRGFISNTDLFHIMMAAYGWKVPARRR
ncbi:MAG: alkaline phosphatase [Bryobacteraceae bacterium]|nr:alkaline phosphatase [Bryobacteraceae bacterium]